MYKIKQTWKVAISNFRGWHRKPQIYLTFFLGFIVSFLLSDKVVQFASEHGTILQFQEAFIWTFGDAQSILIASLLLLLLFADMPNLNNDVPFTLVRTSRGVWLAGQMLYQFMATFLFMGFILLSTCVLSSGYSYTGNMWSDTAAILGYSSIGEEIAVPAFVKVLELTFPYQCTIHIFLLMLGYSAVMTSLMLFLNLWKSKAGMVGGVIFSAFGFLMNPSVLDQILPANMPYVNMANIIFGWISPLNHATYYMHNFGYDNLPRLWQSYTGFIVLTALFFVMSMWRVKRYNFSFTGTQN